jgi:hypothetical protein
MSTPAETEIKFMEWPSIKLFHNLIKSTKYYREGLSQTDEARQNFQDNIPEHMKNILEPIQFKSKVKLHGRNGGIIIENGQVAAQSRSIFVGCETDFGKIAFKGENENYFKSLANSAGTEKIAIFGEYCGPKIQKGVALTKLPEDIFAVFSITIGSEILTEPSEIEAFMTKDGTVKIPPRIFILPWHMEPIYFDFLKDESHHKENLTRIEEEVNRIGELDPWVQTTFGIQGPGEGLVFYPSLKEGRISLELFEEFAFKAKAPEHRVVATKASVQCNPEKVDGVEEFAKLMCPEARLEQGAKEVGGYDMKKMKEFMTWVVKDVQKEGEDELVANGLKWPAVLPTIRKLATTWYKNKSVT